MLVYYMITGLLLPTMLVGFGAIFRSHPPKNINMAFGYRTSRSMKSRESWDFANRYWGALVFRIGLAAEGVTLAVLAAGYLASPGQMGNLSLVMSGLQIVLLFVSIPLTERQLKKRFDDNGKPREGF